jgi:hypothetical protein
MRFFDLVNFKHLMMALFSTLVFIVVFGIGLGYRYFHTKDAEERKKRIIYKYPAGIEDRDAPFPLVMLLIIVGTVIWSFFYILLHGLLGVKI